MTDSLLNEFSAELGEPLVRSASVSLPEPTEQTDQSSLEDDLLDMAFEELGFDSDPLPERDLEDDESGGFFLSGGQSDSLFEEQVDADKTHAVRYANDPLLGMGPDDSTEILEHLTEAAGAENVWATDNTLEVWLKTHLMVGLIQRMQPISQLASKNITS